MDLWKILVLGTLRLNCNWDYDKVHDMANNHNKLREMLGQNTVFSRDRFELRLGKPEEKNEGIHLRFYPILWVKSALFSSK